MNEDNESGKELPEGSTEVQKNVETESEIQSVLDKLSKDKPSEVTEIMTSMMATGPIPNPLHEKINGTHITQVLDLSAKHDERDYNLHKISLENKADEIKYNRLYSLIALISVLVFVGAILYLFKEKPNLVVPVLSGLGGLIGGFFGGWGFGKVHSD